MSYYLHRIVLTASKIKPCVTFGKNEQGSRGFLGERLLLAMALHSSESGSVSLWKQGHSSTELCPASLPLNSHSWPRVCSATTKAERNAAVAQILKENISRISPDH